MSRFNVCLALVVVMVVAGCGSSKSNSGSGASGFVQRADAACVQRSTEKLPGNEQVSLAKSGQQAAPGVQIVVQADKKALATFSSLKPPSAQRASFTSYVQLQRQISNLDEQQFNAARANNEKEYGAIGAREKALSDQGLALAAKAGLTACAKQLPASEVDAIRKVVTLASTTHTASLCTTAFTVHYLKEAFQPGGDVAACVRKQQTSKPANSVEVTQVQGAGSIASAMAALHGGDADGKSVSIVLVKQAGNWKLENLTLNAGTPPAAGTSGQAAPNAPGSTGAGGVRGQFMAARDTANAGVATFKPRFKADARANNLAALKSDLSQLRGVIYTFDGSVRKITFPPSRATDLNALLGSDRTAIADLDALGAAKTPTEVSRLLTTHLAPDLAALTAASRKLQAGL